MLVGVPMEVQSRGRLYTEERHREEIEATDRYGRGTDVQVGLVTVERDTDWGGTYSEAATFTATLGYYGEIRVPRPVRRTLDVTCGDTVRVTLYTTR